MLVVSPRLELLFAVAAIAVGGGYLVFGNVAGAVLVAVGLALVVRLAWIEYDLFGPQE